MINHSTAVTEEQVSLVLMTLDRAIDQLIVEMSKCGGLGGTGRIQSFASILVFLRQAEEIVQDRYQIVADAPEDEKPFGDAPYNPVEFTEEVTIPNIPIRRRKGAV